MSQENETQRRSNRTNRFGSLSVALTFLLTPMVVMSQVYDIAGNQKLSSPVSAYQEAQAEKLRQEQLRLENERLRKENERKERQAQRAKAQQVWNAAAQVNGQKKEEGGSDEGRVYDKLMLIDKLRTDGLLTDAEFDALKHKILEEYVSE